MGDWYLGPNGRWVYDPNAPDPGRDPAVTQTWNTASLRDEEPSPSPTRREDDVPRAGDIGDWIDPNAPDPTPGEVTDPDDPNHVDPWPGTR